MGTDENLVTNLIEKIKSLRGSEREIVAELIKTLAEIYSKKLHQTAGYSSLYSFCTGALGYSSGAAWRRCAAARVVPKTPEILFKLSSGELTLCAVAELSKVINEKNSSTVLPEALGRSREELKVLVAQYQPVAATPKRRERVRVKRVEPSKELPLLSSQSAAADSERLYTVTLELTQEEMELVHQAQAALCTAKVKDTLLSAAKKVISREQRLEQLRERRAAKKECASQVRRTGADNLSDKPRSRYIPVDIRHAVTMRDGKQCSYVSPTGVRCCERNNLELDHIVPFSLGGESTTENLRLLCKTHNLMYAEEIFGRETIEGIIKSRNKQHAGQLSTAGPRFTLVYNQKHQKWAKLSLPRAHKTWNTTN